MSKSIIEL